MTTSSRFLRLTNPVLCVATGVLLLLAATQLHSFLRGLCLGAGVALLVLAATLVVEGRRRDPGSDWLPSRDHHDDAR